MHSITLYRFLQEALTNVIKHAKAEQIWVELYTEGNNAILTVQDNGLGFSDFGHGAGQRHWDHRNARKNVDRGRRNPDQLLPVKRNDHLGLSSVGK